MCEQTTTTEKQTPQQPLKSAWLITNKTNLHVGDEGATSFGIIDKSIQRDALTGIPCINSSSLKGAINEFCCNGIRVDGAVRKKIFGSDKIPSEDNNKEYSKGQTLFFDAHLLFLPRQKHETLYELVYCEQYLNCFTEKAAALGITITSDQIKNGLSNIRAVDTVAEFTQYCSDLELPIIARNVLDNGESKNLWYEQYIPSEAIFGTLLISNDITSGNVLENALNNNELTIQIGANATIGYGYCKFKKL
ncbi:MAG: RAMP superfamily CRISPR-associated protein [Rikenellaceae bacterium]